jgi:acetyl-CoA decarbonylase/synthase complex subunit delta
MITPERLGLCGAYNWLDGKAAFEIDETGPNQPVKKGDCLDPVRGIWTGIDEYVFVNSHKTVASFSAYSIMDRPMTSCGCFEVICAYVPECNGVMAVNREFQGDTPVGMTFSSLAGNVGGGQQTPGFMGCGKVFLTSRKFLFADGGHKRLVWMPKDLKNLLADDLKKRFQEQGVPDLIDQIADETIATDAHEIRAFLEKVGHPALEMEDMSRFAESRRETVVAAVAVAGIAAQKDVTIEKSGSDDVPDEQVIQSDEKKLSKDLIKEIKSQVVEEVKKELKASITKEVVTEIIATLSQKFLGGEISVDAKTETNQTDSVEGKTVISDQLGSGQFASDQAIRPTAAERLSQVKAFNIRKEKCEVPIWTMKLGATKKEGGTRAHTLTVGGATCMPFHLWEGEMPNRPLVAMEVFDVISEKYPPVLRAIYVDLLNDPPQMAKVCVEKFGADLISVRLEGTHPEKGNRTPEQAAQLVKAVLSAVDVPIIVTGHSHYDSINEVMKAVAQACAGENLLLNWVEQDNYRTIAGAALAYGHSIVAQSPIDVNIAKQMNILLTNMDVKQEQIVMDPLTGAMGYGIEYTYSVMERIRLTALNGDKMLAGPMIVSPGQECAKIKELKASEKDFPAWGDLKKRAAYWELTTAVSLLYAGADILIMYHPDAAVATKKTIKKLMNG